MTPPRYWLCRIYLCLSVLVIAGIGLFDTTSQHHDSLSTDGMGGAVMLAYLCGACLIGLVDTICHDLMGMRQCLFLAIRRFRFLWLMALTFGLSILIFANVRWGDIEPLIARYTLDMCMALAVAILDLRTRR